MIEEILKQLEELRAENESLRRELTVCKSRLTFLEEDNMRLRVENTSLRMENAGLRAEIVRLNSILNKNSQNSSKPPSTDGFRKPNPKSLRTKTGQHSGGQVGHVGKTLMQSKNPDEVKIHPVTECLGCHSSLKNVRAHTIEKRQVFEIPEPKIHVIEHRCERKYCPACGKQNVAKFPIGVEQPVQYGPRARGLIAYLQNYQMLPYDRLSEFFKDIYGIAISEGTVFNTAKAVYGKLEPFEDHIKRLLLLSATLHADETGLDVNKVLHWLHSISTDKLTYYLIHEKRGNEAIDAAGVLPNFNGTVVHDCWSPYFKYDFRHALCNAHLLRELNAVVENDKHKWADEMRALLCQLNKATKDGNWPSDDEVNGYWVEYEQTLRRGLTETGGLIPNERTVARNLWERFLLRQNDVLRFTRDPDVPFDNNQAERDVRMAKVKQKVSGCFRSRIGANFFARIRSYISTARKNGENVLIALQNAFLERPYMPA